MLEGLVDYERISPTMWDPLVAGDGPRPVPQEFRVFAAGENLTEKGTYLFDAQAAEKVMAAWSRRGIDLTMDYEHQSMQDPPIEAPASCTRWVPQIRNGELWVTEAKWTDRAACYLAAGEYRYFSPAFAFEKKTGRVIEVFNIALTNNPAMHAIAPLVAASNRRDDVMDYEKLFKELQTKFDAQTAELSAAKAQIAQLAAKPGDKKDDDEDDAEMSAALGLHTRARASERTQAASGLATLRSNIRTIAGVDSDSAALGVITAWKEGAARTAQLSARLSEMETAQLTRTFDGLLEEAGTAGKLAPAERQELRADLLKLTGGKLTADTVETARVCLSRMAPKVSTTGARAPAEGAGAAAGGGTLHPLQVHIAKVCGREPPGRAA